MPPIDKFFVRNRLDMEKIEIIKTYYESNMGKGLPEYGILGWESAEAQRLRFEALVSSVNLQGKRLLDVGCGTGNLYEYIREKGINIEYTGVDLLQSMIDIAKSKKLDAEFQCVDIFKNNPFEENSFDIVYSSGIFNLNLGNNKEFLTKAILLFVSLAKETVAFNLLDIASPDREDPYFYFDPDEVPKIIEKATDKIAKINIVKQYLQNDFTVICHKNPK